MATNEVTSASVIPADVPLVDFTLCIRGMVVSDIDRNDLMSSDEYLRFLSRMSPSQYSVGSFTFDTLPIVLQENFQTLSSGGQIDVFGSKPGQEDASTAQQQFLERICDETSYAIYLAAPTPVQTVPPTISNDSSQMTSSTIDFSQCTRKLFAADTNRDNILQEAEYVRFVNLLGRNEWRDLSITELPSQLQDNYFVNLVVSGGGQVDIFGSKPNQDATAQQITYLHKLCRDTDNLVFEVLNPTQPTEAPTNSQTTIPPTVPASALTEPPDSKTQLFNWNITIHSSFIYTIGNSSLNRTKFRVAYDRFGQQVVRSRPDIIYMTKENIKGTPVRHLASSKLRSDTKSDEIPREQQYLKKQKGARQDQQQRRRQQQRRDQERDSTQSTISYVRDSAFIGDAVENKDCVGVDQKVRLGFTCQTVFARYGILVKSHPLSRDTLYDIYVNATQFEIQNGTLQDFVENEGMNIEVKNQSWPVLMEEGEPNAAGSDNRVVFAAVLVLVFLPFNAALYYFFVRILLPKLTGKTKE